MDVTHTMGMISHRNFSSPTDPILAYKLQATVYQHNVLKWRCNIDMGIVMMK